MRSRGFSFKWKLVENYAAVGFGLIFLWLFVTGIIESDSMKFWASILVILIAPFLITFVDKKSSGQ